MREAELVQLLDTRIGGIECRERLFEMCIRRREQAIDAINDLACRYRAPLLLCGGLAGFGGLDISLRRRDGSVETSQIGLASDGAIFELFELILRLLIAAMRSESNRFDLTLVGCSLRGIVGAAGFKVVHDLLRIGYTQFRCSLRHIFLLYGLV